MRPEEEFCRKAFQAYLEGLGHLSLGWTEEPNGPSKPPDYQLDVAGGSYAVEVTTLMSQHPQSAGRPVSDRGIWRAAERMVGKVEARLAASGLLHGLVELRLIEPFDHLIRSLSELETEVERFLRSEEVSTPTRNTVSGQRFDLRKWGGDEPLVAITTTTGDWDCRIRSELLVLVKQAVAAKAKKLRGELRARVLLLLDLHLLSNPKLLAHSRFELAQQEDIAEAVAQFQSIFVVRHDRSVFALAGEPNI